MSSLDFTPTPPNEFGGQLDQLLHPLTLDYVRTADGEWEQTADSRTIMLVGLSIRLGQSPFDPGDGTAIYELLRQGELVSPEMIQSEVLRVGGIFTREGILSDLLVSVRDEAGQGLVEGSGRAAVSMSWRDLASGSPINEVFTSR